MKSSLRPSLVNGPFQDPALYVALRWQGDALLFDLGRIDRLSPAHCLRLSHVCVSHTHMDHFMGFDQLLRLTLPRDRELPLPDARAKLDRMPGASVPVIHQLWDESDPLPFWAYARFSGNHLYDLRNDPEEEENLARSSRESSAIDALREAMASLSAPREQFVRLGLA